MPAKGFDLWLVFGDPWEHRFCDRGRLFRKQRMRRVFHYGDSDTITELVTHLIPIWLWVERIAHSPMI